MTAAQKIYEPYTGEFTGHLSTYTSSTTKLRYSFKAPCPRVVKHQAYMVELNPNTNQIRLITVTGVVNGRPA